MMLASLTSATRTSRLIACSQLACVVLFGSLLLVPWQALSPTLGATFILACAAFALAAVSIARGTAGLMRVVFVAFALLATLAGLGEAWLLAVPASPMFLALRELSSLELAVAIAAQACLPALELGLDWFDGFVGIVVHADAVVARRVVEDDDGIVHAYNEELSGEAMSGGPVMLAWRDVDEAGETAVDGYNVVVHEFAHVIDMRGGVTARLDEVDPATEHGGWLIALADEYEGFAARIDAAEETFLDPYGAEALEEFFAVASEAFFVAPREFENDEPRTYALLKAFFKQDPARKN